MKLQFIEKYNKMQKQIEEQQQEQVAKTEEIRQEEMQKLLEKIRNWFPDAILSHAWKYEYDLDEQWEYIIHTKDNDVILLFSDNACSNTSYDKDLYDTVPFKRSDVFGQEGNNLTEITIKQKPTFTYPTDVQAFKQHLAYTIPELYIRTQCNSLFYKCRNGNDYYIYDNRLGFAHYRWHSEMLCESFNNMGISHNNRELKPEHFPAFEKMLKWYISEENKKYDNIKKLKEEFKNIEIPVFK